MGRWYEPTVLESSSWWNAVSGVPQYPWSWLPLWCISYWKELHNIKLVWKTWNNGIQWIEGNIQKASGDGQIFEWLKKAKFYVKNLCWRERTDIPGADGSNTSTNTFVAFLSNGTIMNTDNMNMMFLHLSNRAEKDEFMDSLIIIETLWFMFVIGKATTEKHYDQPSSSYLHCLKGRIQNEGVVALVFTAHMEDEKHWLAFWVDFENKEIAYGMSTYNIPQATSDVNVLLFVQYQRRLTGSQRNGTTWRDVLEIGSLRIWGRMPSNMVARQIGLTVEFWLQTPLLMTSMVVRSGPPSTRHLHKLDGLSICVMPISKMYAFVVMTS